MQTLRRYASQRARFYCYLPSMRAQAASLRSACSNKLFAITFSDFGDQWLGTDPWLVIIGILLGTYSGFMKVWHYSKKMLP